jgi:hypothetical protein
MEEIVVRYRHDPSELSLGHYLLALQRIPLCSQAQNTNPSVHSTA